MGTRRTYVRLTDGELRRAAADPGWAKARFLELLSTMYGHPQPEPEVARVLSVDKAWAEIDVVLATLGLDLDAHSGMPPLYGTLPPVDEDYQLTALDRRMYGPPTFLTVAEVAAITPVLAGRPFADLFDAVDPERIPFWMAGEWELDRDYTIHHGEQMQRFFRAAASSGEGLVVDLG